VTRRLRRGRVAALGTVVVVVALVGLAAWLSTTSLVAARTIRVRGNAQLSDARVLEVAGLDATTNVAHLDEEAVARRLEGDPWIARAAVATHLPSTIVVTVRERVPLAVAEGHAVASDGTVLPGAATDGLPSIRAAVGRLSDEQASGAAGVLGGLPQALRGAIEVVTVGVDGTLQLARADGVDVRWGPPGADDAKATSLLAVLRWARRSERSLIRVDVTVPSAPAAVLSDGSTVNPTG
jgi:cell division septal protein FtsQ